MKLAEKIEDKILKEIAEKVDSETPVTEEDARYMLQTNNILDLGTIANHVRTKLNSTNTYYKLNINLNYTNICELRCPLCAYSCDMGDDDAFVLTIDEIKNRVREAGDIDEVHIVGGLHPDLKLDYFEEMLSSIKKINPEIHIIAFTAVEYDYFAKLNNIPLTEVFTRLINAGLNALPGGGAEIFNLDVREKIAPKKITGERWLEVTKTAHSMGLKSNVTMLYNHIEETDDIINHMSRIRNLQEETSGFKTFVPLCYHGENTELGSSRLSTGYDNIRLYSTARIFLHNMPHIKALWMYVGEKTAQVLQKFGVDDFGGTYNNEKVVHSAGAKTSDIGSEGHLKQLIETAGMIPVRVTSDIKDTI